MKKLSANDIHNLIMWEREKLKNLMGLRWMPGEGFYTKPRSTIYCFTKPKGADPRDLRINYLFRNFDSKLDELKRKIDGKDWIVEHTKRYGSASCEELA